MSGYLFFHAKHPALAAIAAALEQAGNAFHNTSEWQGNAEWFDGKTPCELVQAAFDAADASLAESPPVVARQAPAKIVLSCDCEGRCDCGNAGSAARVGYERGWNACVDAITESPPKRHIPSGHVCGLAGYNGMIDPPCPACVANRVDEQPKVRMSEGVKRQLARQESSATDRSDDVPPEGQIP